MTPTQTQASKALTGPLSPESLGQFTYRDGVWYLAPKQTPAPKQR